MVKIKTTVITNLIWVVVLILSIGIYFHRSRSFNKLSESYQSINDDMENLADFYHDVNNTFTIEHTDYNYEIANLLLTNYYGDKKNMGELFADDTVLFVVIVDECLSCLDKNLDVFNDFKNDIIFIAGFRTHRDFLTYNHPNIDIKKSYYVNNLEISQIFKGLENILIFQYSKSSGIISKYVHTYNKTKLTKQYLQIFNDNNSKVD